MNTDKIIEILKKGEKDYLKTKSFSQNPGIYAFFFVGNNFPFLGDKVSKHQIIYIGKTESSQEKRDSKTHFTSGKTGSSTVRKSIGALLYSKENLKPIPRNDVDYQNGRFSHFKFDEQSEIKITMWMINNLALSFYEFPRSKEEIENLETELINKIVPILNISKNPKSSFRKILLQKRKICALIAAKEQINEQVIIKSNIEKPSKQNIMSNSGKYIHLWTKKREAIKCCLVSQINRKSIQLNSEEFKIVGNRKNYIFNLTYINGVISNNISRSAVARDLATVLDKSDEIKTILKNGNFKINMDKNYCLWIEKK